MRVLYIASNPADEHTLLLEREITELQTRFANSSSSGVRFTFLPGLPIERFPREIARVKPDILHISAHGEKDGLVLAANDKATRILSAEALSAFLSLENGPRLVILNACNSKSIAEKIVEVVPMAIGTTAEISNAAARESVRLLYERLLEGQSVGAAFSACEQMIKTIDPQLRSGATISKMNGIEPDTQFFLSSPRIVARFEKLKPNRDGDYEFGLGVIGCPGNTHQVVFFTDDADFADEDDLEDSMCLVTRGTPIRGVIWAQESNWYCYGDMRIFACGVTADGEQFTASSLLSDAITYFHRVKTNNPKANLPADVAEAVDQLRVFDGSELNEIVEKTKKPRTPNKKKKG